MREVSVQEAIQIAKQHHQARRFQEAEAIYRQVLEREPNNADAVHMMGVLAQQTGRSQLAIDLISRAIRLKPDFAHAYYNLGVALKDSGRLDETLVALRKVTELQPDYAEAHNSLGLVLQRKGQLDDAVTAYRKAVQVKPDYADAHNNLGNALREKGLLDEAIAAFCRAIEIQSEHPAAHYNLALALKDKGDLDGALAAYRKAVQVKPDFLLAYYNLGTALQEKGHLDEAIASYRKAVQLKPDYAEAHNNLGTALYEKGHLNEALAAYVEAIRIRPDFAPAQYNLGNALQDKGCLDEAIDAYRMAIQHRPDYIGATINLGVALQKKGLPNEAIAAYDKVIELKPDCAEAHFNLAIMLLLAGRLEEGWVEHEWRWQCKDFPSPRRNFSQPRWNGSDPSGSTILLHAEQGFGDTIQFVRYAPLVAGRGGRVVVECQPELKKLMRSVEGVDCLVARGEPLPPFDMHLPLMSLPLAFGTVLETIPAQVPYLRADPGLVKAWRKKFPTRKRGLGIGLAWAGNPTHKRDRPRSISLSAFAPLADIKGVIFYSLQKGSAAEQAKTPPPGMNMTDLTEELKDFADTAALIANLDLVISVDTAVAHLAGAMAKPVWTLLPFVPDWRWLLEREESPWYPTMRLFRQTKAGDWGSVIGRVAQELKKRVKGSGSRVQ